MSWLNFCCSRHLRGFLLPWTGTLLVLACGCAKSSDNDPTVASRTNGTKSHSESALPPVTLDQLKGVYPESKPEILHTRGNAFACSSDGSMVVTADGHAAELWDMTTGSKIKSLRHSDDVISVALSPHGDELLTATVGRESPVHHWSVETGKLLHEYPSVLVGASDRPSTQQKEWQFKFTSIRPEHGFGFTSVAFSTEADRIAAGCEDGAIVVWNAGSPKVVKRLAGRASRVSSVAFSDDGSRLLAAASRHTIQLWDLNSSKLIKQFEEDRQDHWVAGYRASIVFSKDGSTFAFYGPRSRAIIVCDAKTGREICRLPEESRAPELPGNTTEAIPHVGGLLVVTQQPGLTFFAGGRRLLSHAGWVLKIWDIERGVQTHRHVRRSGVNWHYAHPGVEYVQYLPDVDAAIAVELESDENTGHDFWATVSYTSLREFDEVPQGE